MGKNKRKRRYTGRTDNQGFSLLELLVSMIILILIMVPLMGNFFRSMKLNHEADKIQDYSNLAANIVEEIKAEGIPAVREQVRTTEDGTQYDVRITVDPGQYQYEGKAGHDIDSTPILMNSYKMPDIAEVNSDLNGMYFSYLFKDTAINEIMSYNQLVEELRKHKNEEEISTISAADISGTLQPEDILDCDEIALKEFEADANDYADEQYRLYSREYQDYLSLQEDMRAGRITPYPLTEPTRSTTSEEAYVNPYYCDPDYIAGLITKTIDIQLITDSVNGCTVINYQLIYKCAWPFGLTVNSRPYYEAIYKPYTVRVDNVYLFYQPSRFQASHPDEIHITDNRDIDKYPKANLYIVNQIVKQASGTTGPSDASVVVDGDVDKISLYTNLPAASVTIVGAAETQPINEDIIVTSPPEDRLYAITVTIYKYADGGTEAKYLDKNELYTLNSNINFEK